ncbi:ROK family transcriptional regulator [Bacillus sp. FJAT-50079]|uniref:ROK family transcriptional regulator n=1 Tax=Bacillus sp. FJAT-50079 TaxID=2833577 RepID=UPI001BC9D307|nr:ROK family transcriptional regulator [Bacillus sp. FJAT-50079]MBS4207826.1 ROK family transcriptional regulator [Bacillus sp. FJAT-50079]
MNVTWNQQVVKKENKTLVLQIIRNHEEISRADIAQRSGLNKGTVSSLVAELLEEQLVLEKGPGVSSGGRRPVMLTFNHAAGHSIGIDLGVNYIHAVLTDLSGTMIMEHSNAYTSSSIEQTMDIVKEHIRKLKESAPPTPYGITGIGIGVPGLIDKDSAVLLAPNLGWKNSSIRKEIEAAFDIPVIVENEANAGAYGEKVFGSGKDIENLVYISSGIGIGTGIIINGELYKGVSGFSGEFGHMTIDVNGETCRCGNIGCWELYASEQYLQRKNPTQLMIDDHFLDHLIDSAKQNDPKIIELFEQTANYLGVGIVNIIHAMNPQQLIIGNRLSAAKQWMEPIIQEYVQKHALTSHMNHIQITFSTPSFPATALGMAAFSFESFLRERMAII